MITKTTPLREETHKRVTDIQKMLQDRRNINMTIKDIIEYLIPQPEEGFENIIEKISRN